MRFIKIIEILIACGAMFFIGCVTATGDDISPDVQGAIREAVDSGNRTGIVLGLYEDGSTSIFGYGSTSAGRNQVPDGDTVFALGSVTKVFTAEVLSALSEGKIVSPEATLGEIWPSVFEGSQITLGQLATHTAGLPREISNETLISNSEESLFSEGTSAIETSDEDHHSKSQISYSNLGMALLARALEEAGNEEQPNLLNRYITTPLGMSRTSYAVISDHNVASPHRGGVQINDSRNPTPSIAFGSGGLHSSARDLLTYLIAHVEAGMRPIDSVFARTREGFQGIPYGWQVHNKGSARIFYHSGDGNGYQAFVGFRTDTRLAVVLLANSSEEDDLQQIALHMLDNTVPLPSFPNSRSEPIPAHLLDLYLGNYRLETDGADGNSIAIVNLNDRLAYVESTADGSIIRQLPMKLIEPHVLLVEGLPLYLVFSESPDEGTYMIFNGEKYPLVRTE